MKLIPFLHWNELVLAGVHKTPGSWQGHKDHYAFLVDYEEQRRADEHEWSTRKCSNPDHPDDCAGP